VSPPAAGLAGRHQFRGYLAAEVHPVLPRGPASRRCDNSTEFTSRAVDHRAWANQVRLDFSRPGKPTDNAMIGGS
jgi:putative transposase